MRLLELNQSLSHYPDSRSSNSGCLSFFIPNDNDETEDMESYSLMLLPMLVYCSLVLNYETISVSGRRDDKFWSNPFDKLVSASKFRKADVKPRSDFDFMMAFHPDDLKRAELPIKPHYRWDDRSSTDNRHASIKHVDEPPVPVKITTQRPKPPTTKKTTFKTTEAANEIHVQINDVADLTDILGNSQHYQDIVFAIDQQPDIKLDGNAPSKEKAPKPFWGPPIVTPSTARPTYYARPTTRAVPVKTKEENSIYQTNIKKHSASDPKIGDNKQNSYNQPNEKPTTPEHFREPPVHMQSGPPYYEKRQEDDPFDQGFWHQVPVTEPIPFFGNPLSPETFFHQKYLEAGVASNQEPHYAGILETPVPAVIFKEIDSSAAASYPSPYYPPSPDHHVVYHQSAPALNNYYRPPSGFAQVDFSPIFLAIVPIALFLGAAAAFALATATSSSSASAAVAQQQQQQEESSNNNAANNNNANSNNIAILAALLEVIQSKHDSHDDKQKIIIITTTTAAPVRPPPFVAAKTVPPLEKLASANQLVTLPPDKPLSEEDELADGFDQPGGGTVIEPPILEEEEEPEILTYDL